MRIQVLPRCHFERLRGTSEERELFAAFRVISINSSDEEPPFGGEFWGLPTVLVRRLRIRRPRRGYPTCWRIVRRNFAVGRGGEVFNAYVNRHLAPDAEDDARFRREHPHIQSNPHVLRLLNAEIRRRAG